MEKDVILKNCEGKELHELNHHELACKAGDAADRLNEALPKLKAAFENLPSAAKMAAGDQLSAAYDAIAAVADLALVIKATYMR